MRYSFLYRSLILVMCCLIKSHNINLMMTRTFANEIVGALLHAPGTTAGAASSKDVAVRVTEEGEDARAGPGKPAADGVHKTHDEQLMAEAAALPPLDAAR